MKNTAIGSAQREKGTVEALRYAPIAAGLEHPQEDCGGFARYREAEMRFMRN